MVDGFDVLAADMRLSALAAELDALAHMDEVPEIPARLMLATAAHVLRGIELCHVCRGEPVDEHYCAECGRIGRHREEG